MDNAFIMHILQGGNDLLAIIGCFFFRKSDFGSEFFEKALRTVLKNEVDIFGIVEKSIHLQDIRMIHVHLKFYLPKDLIDHIRLFYFGLAHHLQSIQATR